MKIKIIPEIESQLQLEASRFAEMGYNVLPSNGKIPLITWAHLQENKLNMSEIPDAAWQNANAICLVLGYNSIHALDIDDITIDEALPHWLSLLGLPLDYPWVERSGSQKGYQIFFLASTDLPITKKMQICASGKCGHVELRWKRCASCIPPSLHPDTNLTYEWLHGEPSFDQLVVLDAQGVYQAYIDNTVPDNFLHAEQLPSGSMLTPKGQVVPTIPLTGSSLWQLNPEGTRHTQLCIFAGDRIRSGDPHDVILSNALIWDSQCNCPPLGEEYVTYHVEDLCERYSKKLPIKATDSGLAERLEQFFGATIRYNHSKNRWMIWNGRYWEIDEKCTVHQLAKQVVRMLQEEVRKMEHSKERDHLIRFALKSEDKNRINSMLFCAQSLPGLASTDVEFDSNPNWFNLTNGVYDLKENKLLPHSADQMQTKCSPVVYDPIATCPQWTHFLQTIFEGDQDIIQFIQRALGYSLTGDVAEKVIFFLIGEKGNNGKSVMSDKFGTPQTAC